jgi:hypothetical protein
MEYLLIGIAVVAFLVGYMMGMEAMTNKVNRWLDEARERKKFSQL